MPTDYTDILSLATPEADQWGRSAKYEAVQEASRTKIAGLQQRAAFQLALKKAQEDSFVGKLGLDPNSTLGTVANTALATAGDAVDIASKAMTLPLELAGKQAAADSLRKALSYAGQIAPRDDTEQAQSGLVRRLVGDPAVALAGGVVGLGDAVIGVGDIATLGMAGKGWDALGRDSKATHKFISDLYSPEQTLANQNVQDATGFLGTVEAMLNNPTTIVKGVIESLPAMLAGGGVGRELLTKFPATAAYIAKTMPALAGLTEGGAGAIGEGITMAGSAAEDIRNDNADGRLSFKQALLSAGVGVMGAAVARVGGKTAERLGVGDIDQAMVAGKLAKSQRGYTMSTGLAGAVEGGEEAIQSAGETILKNIAQDKQWDLGVGEAAAQGMMTAMPMGAYSGLGERAAHGAKEHADKQTAKATQEAVITSGDVTPLVNPKNSAYAPAKAIDALSGHSALPDTTPERQQGNLVKAGEIVADLQTRRDEAKNAYDAVSPEALKANQDFAATIQVKLASETDPVKAKDLQESLVMANEQIASMEKPDPQLIKERRAALAVVDQHLTDATASLARFHENLSTKTSEAEVASHVGTINAPIDEADTVAVAARSTATDKLINLSMAVPERLDTNVAASLANNQANGLSATQRAYLRAFSAARIADIELKDMGKVSQEIYHGDGKGNLGLVDHRQRVTAALAAGNQALADRQLAVLQNFEEDHRTKADLSVQATEENKKTGQPAQVIRNQSTKAWEMNRGPLLSKAEAKANRPVTIHNSTPTDLVPGFKTEASAITKTLAEMQAAYAVKFPTTITAATGAKNVPNVSQAHDAPQAQPVAQQASPAVGSVAAVSGNPEVAAAGAGTTGLEAAGVSAPITSGTSAPVVDTRNVPAAIKAMSDEKLNAALEAEISKLNYQKRARFQQLDAEMTYRETQTTAATSVDSQVSHDTGVAMESKGVERVTDAAKVSNQFTDSTTKAADAIKSEAQPESAEQTSVEPAQIVAEPAVEAPQATGTLAVMGQKSVEGTPYNLRNLIATGFTQTAMRDGEATQRPLVAMKNFLSEGWDSIMTYLPIKKLSEDGKQLAALEAFFDTAMKWAETIRANLPDPKKNDKYRYEDMMQFLLTAGVDGQLDVDENVKTAIAATAYAWTADAATSTRQATDKSINALLGRDKKAWVSPLARRTLGTSGEYQHMIVDTLGAQVMQYLGLKLKPDASQELEPKLRTALGLHALKLMEDTGLVTRTTVMGNVIAQMREEGLDTHQLKRLHDKHGVTKADAPHYFFAVARDESGRAVAAVQKIFEANRGTQDVLGKLLGVASRAILPSLSPITTVQNTTSGTGQSVPTELQKVQLLKQSRARVVRKDKMDLIGAFDEAQIESMIGVKEEENKSTHLVNRAGIVAKNDGLRREYRLFVEYVGEYLATAEKGLDTPFYLPFDVWKQQRVGIASNVVNPQASKIVRFLIGSPEWTTEIDPKAKDAERLMDSFYLRVAEGLGVKTERADNLVSIAKVQAMLKEPVYVAAIAALIKQTKQQKLSAEDKASIVAAVAKGGEKLHTLDALMGVAQQQAAMVDGVQQTFAVQMMGEVDGVANGTMLNHVLTGAGSQSMLNQGGFFEVGHPDTQYNQWRGKLGNLDIYETMAKKISQALAGMFVKDGPEVKDLTSIWAIAGKLFDEGTVTKDGRNLVKDALNPVAFGSSLESMATGMSYTFLSNVYAGFEKLSVGTASQGAVDAYVAHVNQLIFAGEYHVPTGLPIAEYMEMVLSETTSNNIRATFLHTVGEATTNVVQKEFGSFLARRDDLNNTTQLTHGLYEAVHKGMREAYVEELLASGELEKLEGGRINDLSKKQEAELQKRLRRVEPVIQTSMSKGDPVSKNSGLRMAKTQRRQSTDPAYANKTQFGTPIKGLTAHSNKRGWIPQTSTNLSGIVTVTAPPGVAMGSATTHSGDSATLARVEAKRDILGVHDAAGDGVAGLEATARLLNEKLWDMLVDYSPLDEAYQAMAAVMGGITAMQKDGTLSPQAVRYLQAHLREMAWKVNEKPWSKTIFQTMLTRAHESAYQADKAKLTLMQNWAWVDQYAYQGGNYHVTDANRADAAGRLAALKPELSTKAADLLTELRGFTQIKPGAVVTTAVHEGVEAPVGEDSVDLGDVPENFDMPWDDEETSVPIKPNPFGDVGKPRYVSQPLVDFFNEKGERSASEVIKQLIPMMDGNKFNRLLLGMLARAMPQGVTVKLVTPEMTSKDVLDLPNTKSFGWIVGNSIYVLSEGFVNSGLQTPEVLLHELVHGALAQIIEKPTGSAVALVAGLNTLMEKAAAYAQQNGITEFNAALSDIHEFVAYGMTQKSFQRILSKVAVPASTQTNTLVDGFKDFISKLVGLLFTGSNKTAQEQANTALAGLIQNVTGLLQQGTEEQGNSKAQREGVAATSAPLKRGDSFTFILRNGSTSEPQRVSAEFSMYGHQFVVHKTGKGFGVTETSTGFGVYSQPLRRDIIEGAKEKLLKKGEGPFLKMMATTLNMPVVVIPKENTGKVPPSMSMVTFGNQVVGSLVDSQTIMSLLGFKTAPAKFADIAAKLLTNPDQNIAMFIKDSSLALSHILMKGPSGQEIRDALQGDTWYAERARITARLVKTGMMRGDALVDSYRVLTEQALMGELVARTKAEKSLLAKLIQAVNDFIATFRAMAGSTEFTALVRDHLNDAIERAYSPAEIKRGYKKVSFQEAVDADLQSARVLAHMSQNPAISITGSIVLAETGTIYRDAANMLHDLDFLVKGDKAPAEAWLRKAFPDAVQVYDFNTSNGKVDSYLVPPAGAKIVNIKRESGEKSKVIGFEVERDGKTIGRTWNDENGEHKSGDAGTFVDLFTNTVDESVSTIPFTVEGKSYSIKAAGAGAIFDAKLSMGRPKDMGDYANYVPKNGGSFAAVARVRPNLSQSSAPDMETDPIGVLNTYSTLDIHNALNPGDVTPAFDTKLKDLLGGIVEKLHGPFGEFKARWMKEQALNAGDVWHKALATGQTPFASSALVSPLMMSEREAHAMEQVEATVRAALEHDENTTSSAYRGLNILFTEMVGKLKPSDFANPAAYDFIFKIGTGANGRTHHLARFAAFGLAHQEFNKMLQVATAVKGASTSKSIAQRLEAWFNQALEFFHEKVTGAYAGQQADIKLDRLVGQLVDIEAKKRLSIARRDGEISMHRKLENKANELVHSGLHKLADIVDSKFVQENRFNSVKFVGTAVRTTLDHRVADAFQELVKMRLNQTKGRLSIVAGAANYAFGDTGGLEKYLRAREMQEQGRHAASALANKMALQAFAGKGAGLDTKASASITQMFMRTGMHALTDQFNMTELEHLLGNKPATDAAIAGLEAQLTGLGNLKNLAINQANALAYYKVTGNNYAKFLMMNAHNIARMYGHPQYQGKVTEAQANQVQPVLEKLIALYAMGYVSPKETAQAKEVLRSENARTDGGGNGVEFVMAMAKRFDSESRDRLFQGQEALMVHGFTPEIYSPYVEVVTAAESDGPAMKRRGYVEGAQVDVDPAHPDQTKRRLYALEGGGTMPYLTGIISNKDRSSKGTTQHSNYLNVRTADGLANAALNADILHGKQGVPDHGPRKDLSKGGQTNMAPVVNAQGEIVNWRYLMQDSTKDTILKRKNGFNHVMGALAGSIFDKDTAAEVNTRVFEAMKEMHDADHAKNSDAYVLIGPKGTDSESREIWGMLSNQAKLDARRIWGKDGIYVRRDLQDLVFGYRKLSIANAIRSTQNARTEAVERETRGMSPVENKALTEQFETLMAKMLTLAVEHGLVLHARARGYDKPEEYGARAAVRVAQGEQMWLALVKETKDVWVIKTVTSMMHNQKSNVSLLVLSGVPRRDIWRDHVIAWRGATSWQADSTELARLQALLDIGQTNGKEVEIRNQMARLSDALDRNPVKKLIEEGLMPTIVEDTSEDEDPYSYKSALVKKMDKLGDKLHPGVKAIGKQLYMAKATKAYQSLRHITQLSDFMARYTQYVYVTTRKTNPLSHEDAIQQSSDDFVNYKIPMHRGMQYLDDTGIMPFMKYFLRIQKVIERLAKENPARVLAAELLGNVTGMGSSVLDSEWTRRIGNNPLQWGALEYPGSLRDLASVKAVMALIK